MWMAIWYVGGEWVAMNDAVCPKGCDCCFRLFLLGLRVRNAQLTVRYGRRVQSYWHQGNQKRIGNLEFFSDYY